MKTFTDIESSPIVDQAIRAQATESSDLLREQGWDAANDHRYEIGAFPGDVEALTVRLGRVPTKGEVRELETQIRIALVD